jgi:hypothetical protein
MAGYDEDEMFGEDPIPPDFSDPSPLKAVANLHNLMHDLTS